MMSTTYRTWGKRYFKYKVDSLLIDIDELDINKTPVEANLRWAIKIFSYNKF